MQFSSYLNEKGVFQKPIFENIKSPFRMNTLCSIRWCRVHFVIVSRFRVIRIFFKTLPNFSKCHHGLSRRLLNTKICIQVSHFKLYKMVRSAVYYRQPFLSSLHSKNDHFVIHHLKKMQIAQRRINITKLILHILIAIEVRFRHANFYVKQSTT